MTGNDLREFRRCYNLSQETLGEYLGHDQAWICKIEREKKDDELREIWYWACVGLSVEFNLTPTPEIY